MLLPRYKLFRKRDATDPEAALMKLEALLVENREGLVPILNISHNMKPRVT